MQSRLPQGLLDFADACYRQPLLLGIVLSILSSWYLIIDWGVVHKASLDMLWDISQYNRHASDTLHIPGSQVIAIVSRWFALDVVTAGYWVMVVTHALIVAVVVLIAQQLSFSLLSQWALLFLLLAHSNYNDFRTYITIEPLFWLLWLSAIYVLLRWHRSQSVMAIGLWLILLLIATRLNVAAWFWLLLFPFGALMWKPWRRKSVAYALLGYAVVVGVLLFLPLYHNYSPWSWLQKTVLNNPNLLAEVLSLDNNWVKNNDPVLSGIFVISGASSLILVRLLIMLSIAGVGLAIYGVQKRQYQMMTHDKLRIVVYAIGFDVFISVILLVLGEDKASILSFSTIFLCLLFSASGLSYIFKKIQAGHYSRLSVLVIVWCLVAYIASGFIIFGPKHGYRKAAADFFVAHYPQQVIGSNDSAFLFYTGSNPNDITESDDVIALSKQQRPKFYGYVKSRKKQLPIAWQGIEPIAIFSNPRGDQLRIYQLVGDAKSQQKRTID